LAEVLEGDWNCSRQNKLGAKRHKTVTVAKILDELDQVEITVNNVFAVQ